MANLRIDHGNPFSKVDWNGYSNILFEVSYDQKLKQTTVTFGNSFFYYYGLRGYGSKANVTLTVTADDNPGSQATATFTADIPNSRTDGHYNNYYGTTDPISVTVQHSSKGGKKSVTINGVSYIYLYVYTSSWSDTTANGSVTVEVDQGSVVHVGDKTGSLYVYLNGAWRRGLIYAGMGGQWHIGAGYIFLGVDSGGEEEPGGLTVTYDQEGNVYLSGVVATHDGAGNVTLSGVTAVDDGNGNITIT